MRCFIRTAIVVLLNYKGGLNVSPASSRYARKEGLNRFPLSLLLLSVGVILAYLAIGEAWSANKTEIVVYTPETADVPNHR
ncbi:hypothetical protein SAMCCGM7_pC0347 (plasmid) [Sinorhizobium americanum CCGM7]|nr:hypothetical protein SAMCCGM7_pC0347 [Sinorhizobium americanum CCGM7]